ncbi:MAG: PVC-type heme-binding CxxCH protein [Roseibacillus sp.]
MNRHLLSLFVIPALALPAMAAEKPKPLFTSPVVTSKTPGHAVSIDVDLKGSRSLFLVVDETSDGYGCDWVNWIEPRVVGAKGELKLTELKWKSAISGWGNVRVNANASGGKLIVNGKPVSYGIGTHAPSTIEYFLPEGYTRFQCRAGLDQGGVSQQGGVTTSARFQVWNKKPAGAVSGGVAEVPLDRFVVPDDLEITVWAQSPLFRNPTNIDIDHKGRIWVAEGVNYRGQRKDAAGDRIVVLQDVNGDGVADKSHTFVQETHLQAPLGVAVFDNVVVVSQPPDLIVYTDLDRDLVFDPEKDKREVLLTGFNGRNHDHSLHSVIAGPDGKWYFNQGNTGAQFTDNSGKTFRIGSPYSLQKIAGQKSDDGHVYLGGFSVRMNPDGTDCEVIGHNYRNSYEQIITSMGDLFQNDNDDPPACRTGWVMEYGNAGFASTDGKRSWGADRRPGQDTPTAEWRQQDPGSMPPGDVYGGGAPTGISFYENGALPKKYRGLLLSCESAKNVVFGYFPKLKGAGFEMERFDFLTSNPDRKWAGADFKGRSNQDLNTWFRPADVCVGPDGAIYVADWFDPRVGGHGTQDRTLSGRIYRIAPKGFKPSVPKLDLSSVKGQVTALRSPAINTRYLGFKRLLAGGDKSIPALSSLAKDENPYLRARAIWLLAQLGPKGAMAVMRMPDDSHPQTRITAFRSLRRAGYPRILDLAFRLADDDSPAIRREVAFFFRNQPASPEIIEALVKIAQKYDGEDRAYLEAFGTGATGKEGDVFAALVKNAKAGDWNATTAAAVWRLMTPPAVPALRARVFLVSLPGESRMEALESIAFIRSSSAADAMVDIANLAPDEALSKRAAFWVKWNNDRWWKSYKPADKLKGGNAKQELVSIVTPEDPGGSKLPSAEEILKLDADAARGKIVATRCVICHVIDKVGVDVGPNLTGWGQRFPREVIVRAILEPSAEISLGFEGQHIVTKSGHDIMGIVLSHGDPVIVKSMGGVTQAIPADDIKSRTKMKRSLMLSANQQQLTAQDVADVVEYLRSGE